MNRRKRAAARESVTWAQDVELETVQAAGTKAGEAERQRGVPVAQTMKEAWIRVRDAADRAEDAVPGRGLGAQRRAWAAAFLAQLVDLPGLSEAEEREKIGKLLDTVVFLLNLGVYVWKARQAG